MRFQPPHNRGGHGGPGGPGGPGPGGERGDFNRRRGPGPGGPHGNQNFNEQGGHPGRNSMDKVSEKLANIAGPTYDLPPLEIAEKKFSGRTRLYVGNIGNDVTENDLSELFRPFGETSEYFLNKEKNFAFVRVVSISILS